MTSFSPQYLIFAGVLLSGVGAIWNSYQDDAFKNKIIEKSNTIESLQGKLIDKAKESENSQKVLREKSDEIADLNRGIAEKAEEQLEIQKRLTEKSEEIALLNSHISHMQKTMQEKAEHQGGLQNTIKELLEDNAVTSNNIINFQKQNRDAIVEVKGKLSNIETALNDYGIKVPKTQNAVVFVDGVTAKVKVGTISVSVNDSHFNVQSGQTRFFEDLTVYAVIKSVGNKKYVHARFMTTDEGSKVLDTDKIGYKASCGKYTLTVHEIDKNSVTFIIHVDR